MATLENEAVRELKSKVSGQVLLPSDAGYDEARTLWNAMIDLRPAVIVRCVSAQDVIHAVRPAREQKLVLAVRGGGHNIAGNASATAQFVLNVHGRWEDPAKDAKRIAWARELFQAASPFATGGAYVNFMTQEEQDRVRAAYGSNYDRLVRIKKKYGPENFFRVNQNIRPSA